MSVMSWRAGSRALLRTTLSLAAAAATLAVVSPAAQAAGAVVDDADCRTSTLTRNDDASAPAVALPSPLAFYDREVSTVFVNNNGNLSFDQPLSSYSGHISTLDQPLIAPFFADVDTSVAPSGEVTYGTTNYGGRPAICAAWPQVGYFPSGTDRLNTFQAYLVDRSDVAAGDFDVVFNYDQVQWDPGQVGFSAADGDSEHVYVFPGSSASGRFVDTNLETGLVHGSRGSEVLGRYVFEFRAGFPQGVTPPETAITSGPTDRSSVADPVFTYTATTQSSGEHLRFECRLTAAAAAPGAFSACPDSGQSYTDLADATYDFEVRAVDVYLSTDSTPASATFTVDTTGPTTRLDEVAAARSNDTTPSFAWSSADADRESFECTLDRTDSAEPSPWEACGTEDTFGPLGDGAWTFQVRGVDDLGNRGVPASHDFVIDTEGTGVTIVDAPATIGNHTTPSFTYTADPADDVDHFECVLVPVGAQMADPTTCDAAGWTTEPLADGDYRFSVWAVDLAGNVGDPAWWEFTVDTASPDVRITSAARAIGNDPAPRFTYATTATDLDHYQCVVVPVGAQSASPETCDPAGHTSAPLTDGEYVFAVVAVDRAGNESESARTRFTVDTVAAETTITGTPAPVVDTSSATFDYAADDAPVTFECRLGAAGAAGAWESCPQGRRTFDGLADGAYGFEVRATDAAGNTDATPAAAKVAVNVGRPTITAVVDSEGPISQHGWYRDAVTITYTCEGNGSPLVGACPAPREVPRVQQGKVVFRASIATADGDTASVRTLLYIDKGKPKATIKGFSNKRVYRSMPTPRCQASDPRSGLDRCTLEVRKVTRKDGRRFVVVRAKAVDRAGNVRVVRKKARFRRS